MIELVAEIGINANGDLSIAKRLIDVAHSAGFHYVKFQKRTLESCYTKEELDKPRVSPWGTTTREQKIGIEFTVAQYHEINEYCKNKGIKWFASPWDSKSIFHIVNCGSCFVKIPSALLTWEPYIKLIVQQCDKPIILSTGMSTMQEIHKAVNIIPEDRLYAILHCTSTYPSKNEEQNIKMISTLKKHFPLTKIGFSNHSPGLTAMLMAAGQGAEIIETHITLDRAMYGSDQAASIEPEGMFKLGKHIRAIPDIMGDGVKKIYDSELPIMEKLRK